MIAIGANAVCGTRPARATWGQASVLGHEAAGVVNQTCPGTTMQVCTRGAIYLTDFYGDCRSCRWVPSISAWPNAATSGRRSTGFRLVRDHPRVQPLSHRRRDDNDRGDHASRCDGQPRLRRAALVRSDLEIAHLPQRAVQHCRFQGNQIGPACRRWTRSLSAPTSRSPSPTPGHPRRPCWVRGAGFASVSRALIGGE